MMTIYEIKVRIKAKSEEEAFCKLVKGQGEYVHAKYGTTPCPIFEGLYEVKEE